MKTRIVRMFIVSFLLFLVSSNAFALSWRSYHHYNHHYTPYGYGDSGYYGRSYGHYYGGYSGYYGHSYPSYYGWSNYVPSYSSPYYSGYNYSGYGCGY